MHQPCSHRRVQLLQPLDQCRLQQRFLREMLGIRLLQVPHLLQRKLHGRARHQPQWRRLRHLRLPIRRTPLPKGHLHKGCFGQLVCDCLELQLYLGFRWRCQRCPDPFEHERRIPRPWRVLPEGHPLPRIQLRIGHCLFVHDLSPEDPYHLLWPRIPEAIPRRPQQVSSCHPVTPSDKILTLFSKLPPHERPKLPLDSCPIQVPRRLRRLRHCQRRCLPQHRQRRNRIHARKGGHGIHGSPCWCRRTLDSIRFRLVTAGSDLGGWLAGHFCWFQLGTLRIGLCMLLLTRIADNLFPQARFLYYSIPAKPVLLILPHCRCCT